MKRGEGSGDVGGSCLLQKYWEVCRGVLGLAVISRGGILVYDARGPEMPNNVQYTSPGPTR